MRRHIGLFALGITAAVIVPWAPSQFSAAQPAISDADQKRINDDCETAYEDAQRAQNGDHLVAAKASYGKCSGDVCPKGVRNECAKAMQDLEPNIPTAVFDAVDESGAQIIATHVSVDGREIATSIDGHAVQVDPGPHKVHFESAGKAPVDLDVVILAGQSHRTVQGRFGGGGSDGGGERPYGAAPWIVAISGLAVLGTGIGVLVPGEINISKADKSCPGRVCANQAAVDLGQQGIAMSTAGKVLVPIGAVTFGTGLVWQFLWNRKRAPAQVSLTAGPGACFGSVTSPF